MENAREPNEDFSEVAFVVLVEVPAGIFPRREAYVVACSIPDAAKAKIRELYADEPIALPAVILLPSEYAKTLRLKSGEVLPWQ
jgi:hypothetical protein